MEKGLIHPRKIYQSITPRPLCFKIVEIKRWDKCSEGVREIIKNM